jgi:hypothetical protein
VWEAKPTADAMLHARLARGWKPTASPLKDGDRVLGHACTLTHGR